MTAKRGVEFERMLADVRERVRRLTQQPFEQTVLRRDYHRCRVCGSDLNVAAHHIEFLRDVCRRIAVSTTFDLDTPIGRRRLVEAIEADPGVKSRNGISLCSEDHARAHSHGQLSPETLRELIADVPDPPPIANAKLIVREARSLAETYSVAPLGALEEAGEPIPVRVGQMVGFRDFVGPPFQGKVGRVDRVATMGDHVMVRFSEPLAVPGCRARLHFQFDRRMLGPP